MAIESQPVPEKKDTPAIDALCVDRGDEEGGRGASRDLPARLACLCCVEAAWRGRGTSSGVPAWSACLRCVDEAGGGGIGATQVLPACPRDLLRNRSGLCCALWKQPNQNSPTTWQTGKKGTGVGLFGAHQDGPDGFKKSTRCLVTVWCKPHFDRRPRA